MIFLQIFFILILILLANGSRHFDNESISANFPPSIDKMTQFDLKPDFRRAMWKVYYEAKLASKFCNCHAEKKIPGVTSYLEFLKNNSDHIVVFLLPIFLFVFFLFFIVNQVMKSSKELNERYVMLKRKYVTLIVYKQNYLHLLRAVKKEDKILFMKLSKICETHKINIPPKL